MLVVSFFLLPTFFSFFLWGEGMENMKSKPRMAGSSPDRRIMTLFLVLCIHFLLLLTLSIAFMIVLLRDAVVPVVNLHFPLFLQSLH